MIELAAVALGVILGHVIYDGVKAIRRRKVRSQHVTLRVYGPLSDSERAALKLAIDKLP